MKKEQTFVLIHVNGGLDNMGDRKQEIHSKRSLERLYTFFNKFLKTLILADSVYPKCHYIAYYTWKSLFGASHFYTFLEDSDQVYIEQYQILIP
ncbi:unnamed protein product [Rhizophagus irregularis]|nr:unnamed protein product [Rhizophagus irregularis]